MNKILKLIFVLFFLQTSLSLYSNNRKKAINLTQKGIKLNNNSKAEIKFYLDAIKLDPHYANAYFNLGNIYFDKKKYNKAINYFLLAHKRNAVDNDILYNLALAYYFKRDYIESIKILNLTRNDLPSVYLLCKIYSHGESKNSLNAAVIHLKRLIRKTKDAYLLKDSQNLLKKINKKLKIE